MEGITQSDKDSIGENPKTKCDGNIEEKIFCCLPTSADHFAQLHSRKTHSQIRQPKKHQLCSNGYTVEDNVAVSLCELTLFVSAAVRHEQHQSSQRNRVAVLPQRRSLRLSFQWLAERSSQS